MSAEIEQEIKSLEEQRLAALISADIAILGSLLTDDLVHVHGTGKQDTKEEYLHGVSKKYKYHRIERGDLNIRIYDDIAIVVGPLSQTVSIIGDDKRVDVSAMVTQTWIRVGGSWRQNTCHNGFLAA